ncbi:MAG TPA: outer membrane protein transport protein [Anaeromyxobacteraceae bacterium]|nr:outer membrane protein transport protein [Anaeromyxobacteraceae bacterium]
MRKTLIAAVLLVPALALASGYEVPNVNPRELAMVSSTVAAQPAEAAATNVNPAALSKIEGLALSLSGSILSLHTTWTAPAAAAPQGLTGSESTNFHPVPPVALFVAYGTKLADRGVGLGFGMGNPAGGNMFWDDNWQGRGRIETVQRRFYGFYLNGGVEVIPDMLRLGGGAIYYYATQYLKQGVQPVPGAFAELETKGGAFSYEAAAEFKPLRDVPLTLGIDYKHKAHTDQEGEANFDVPPALLSATIRDQDVKSSLVMPNLLHVGVGFRPVKPLLITAGWSLVRFVVYKEDLFVGSTGLEIAVPRDYRNGYGLRLGAEYDLSKAWTVRGGFFRDISGLRTRTYSPTLPDSDSWVVAAGASYRVRQNFAVNGAFYYADRDRVEATDTTVTNPDGSFPGSYKTRAYIASLGITYNLPELGRR